MSALITAIPLRPSCLVERAYAIASGFDRIGKRFSADLTRGFARDIEAGAPSALYEHWIGQQADLLAEWAAQPRIAEEPAA